jgi:hypothetical protein
MVDDHEYFVGDGQRSLLLADTYFETPKGAPQEGGRFPSAPGTLHQDPAEVAIPFARFAVVPSLNLSRFVGGRSDQNT